MTKNILGNIDMKWFIDFIHKFTQRKFIILEWKITIKNKTYYKYVFGPKDGLKINLVQYLENGSGDQTAKILKDIMYGNERTKISRYFGLDKKYSNFFMILFKLILEEHARIDKGDGSLLDLPSFKRYEESNDLRYKEYLEDLQDKPMWTEKELLAVYNNTIAPLTKPNLSRKKLKLDKRTAKVIKDHNRYDMFGAAAFKSFVNVVNDYLSSTNSSNKATDMKNASVETQDRHTMKQSPDDMLNVDEAARYISRSPATIYRLTSNNEITYNKPGDGKLYIKRKELDKYINRNEKKSKVRSESDSLLDNMIPRDK